jgi:tricorn protease
MTMRAFAFTVVLSTLLLPAALHGAAGYYTTPDIHGNLVVFAAEGDLWLSPGHRGPSLRLTTHPGPEYFPSFSPDGARIAFTGEHDGNRDVFVILTTGGEPRRLTWHPDRDEVVGWTPDGTRVIFRSPREHPHRSWELYTVPAAGGDVEKMPLGWAARIAIDPETGTWAFNRRSRETRTWKRYRGGTASDIWVGHPDREDYRKVTGFEGTDAFPMWHGGRVWFLSDKGGTYNIWSMLPDGSDRKRHTDFGDWDVRWPAMGPDGRIVFVLGADVHLFLPKTGKWRMLDLQLPSDRVLTRVRYPDPERYITSFDLSPDGGRVLLVSRGEIFSVPVKDGVTLRLGRGSGARERGATYGPEGERIAYVSDALGEETIETLDAWGRGEPTVVKPAGDAGWHFPPLISPDGKWVAFADQTHTLYVVPARGGTPRAVDRAEQEEIREYAWSPDGRWLAYAKIAHTDFGSIFLYDTKTRKTHAVTGPTTNDRSPAWDPKGRYLYFLSERTMNPFIGWRDFETVELRMTKPYLVLLREDEENPLAPLAGAPGRKEEEEKPWEKWGDKGKEDEKAEPVRIDIDGLADRFVELPVDLGLYGGLAATEDRVFYLSFPLQGMAEGPGWLDEEQPQNDLIVFDLEEKEAKPFLEGITSYVLVPGAGKMAVMRKLGELFVVGAEEPPGEKMEKGRVSLGGVVLELDPREEWRQIYYEAWRNMRDFHWEPGMSGLDWERVRDQYSTLLPRLASREDLRDLLGELIGELCTSHTYVWGGDSGVRVPRVGTGLLGADVERVEGGYRVTRIYRGDPADNERSPLSEPEAAVREGEVVLAVNNAPFADDLPFEAAFQGLAGKQVLLKVGDGSAKGKSREVVVTPRGGDRGLRYADWVRRNREYVAEKTDGKVAYIHIPNMMSRGMIEFDTWFYPQLDREGMVVDARWNGGGFVSQLMVERLRRKVVSFDRSRGGGVWPYPYRTLNGPFVVLTNQFAGSDGDIFPMAIQLEGLAPIIGMRSWGGVVGIRADKPLVDGGILTQPEYAWWDPRQGWGLENHGVDPDIVVENPPQAVAKGDDAQLDRAIEEVLRLHEERPPVKPDFGPAPDKSRGAFEREEL